MKGYGLVVFHKFYLLHSWVLCPIWSSLPWKSKEDSYRPKYTTSFFFTVKKETTNEPSKVLTRKNLFLQCYWSVLFISVIGTTCFDVFFHDNWKVLFFEKDYCWLEVLSNRHVLTFFEINNLKEIRILSFTSKIAVESNTKTPKWSSRMSYLVDSFNVVSSWCSLFCFENFQNLSRSYFYKTVFPFLQMFYIIVTCALCLWFINRENKIKEHLVPNNS